MPLLLIPALMASLAFTIIRMLGLVYRRIYSYPVVFPPLLCSYGGML